jgi:UDP-glucuronate 4-epimerase
VSNKSAVLVTGSAGFIGAATTMALLARGERVIGLDNLNDYYDPALKQARLKRCAHPAFCFVEADVSDTRAMQTVFGNHNIDRVIHLAAQAGVRYSFENPQAYIQSNVAGFVELLERARHHGNIRHVVYASSSSVYGANTKQPFSVDDPVNDPVSLYAATKRAGELIAQVYALQFGLRLTGLRFFTVYGPWGRPDMAPLKFTRAIMQGQPIDIYGQGQMERDFTYIDDIVAGTLAALDDTSHFGDLPHRVYNLGNHQPEALMRFIQVLENAIGTPAIKVFKEMQAGDVRSTAADIDATRRDLGWAPTTRIDDGLPQLVDWAKTFYGNCQVSASLPRD